MQMVDRKVSFFVYLDLILFLCEFVMQIKTAYKRSLTSAREFDRVPIRPYWPSRK